MATNFIKKLKLKSGKLSVSVSTLDFVDFSNYIIPSGNFIPDVTYTNSQMSLPNLLEKYTLGEHRVELSNGNYLIINIRQKTASYGDIQISFYNKNGTNASTGASVAALSGVPETYDRGVTRQSGNSFYAISIFEWNGYWRVKPVQVRWIPSQGSYQIYYTYGGVVLPLTFFDGSIDDSTDPYTEDQEPSTTGGGGSVFTGGDTIGIPSLPSVSVTDTGFVALYNPSETDLRNLASAMWSTDFFDNIIKMWANPMDCILGLSLFPCPVSSTGGEYIKVGNVQLGVPMPKVNTQYVEVDCGTLDFKKGDYNFLDYAPYSQLNIYVPYCGFYAVDIDEVMGKTLGMKYHIDLWSGSCVAYLTVNGSVHKQFTGKCSYNIPITSSNYSNLVNNIVSSVASIGGAIGSGGLSGVGKSIMAAADTVLSAKPTIETNASFGGNVGLLCLQKPFLFLERPDFCLPENGNKLTGYPTYINDKLSNFKGYTEVETVFIKSSKATESEVAEIQALLKGGVFL